MALRILVHHRDPVLSGDPALLDLASRSAAGFHRQLGPYSRFGYNHPGPALFYAAAPVYWLTRNAAWGLSFAVEVINGVAAAGIVFLFGRRAGDAGALLGAAVVLLYCWRVDIGLLQVPWNPLVILLPLALVLVAAAEVDGPGVALAVVLLSGSFVVQTHLGTTPVVVAAAVLAVVFAVVHRRVPRGRPAALSVALGGAAAVLWLPPLVQQVTHHPGNLGLIVRFFRQPNPGAPGLRASLADTGRELAVLGRGIPYLGSLTPGHPATAWAFAVVAAGALAAVAVYVGLRVGAADAARLGVVALVALVVSVWAVHSIRGEVFWYLAAWISAVAVPAALAWVAIVARMAGDRAMLPAAVLFAVALGAALASATGTRLYDNRAFPREPAYRADVQGVWAVVAHSLPAGQVLLDGDAGSIPALAGLAQRLELRGLAVRVTPDLGVYFGPERVVRHRVGGAFYLAGSGSAPPPGSRRLGSARELVVWQPPAAWAG
jgi:hypothetical protein